MHTFVWQVVIKNGDVLSPLLFNFPFQYAIRTVQTNQEGLKLNGTHQILIYADNINILGETVHIIKTPDDLLVSGKENGLQGNEEKTKYMFIYSQHNARQHHNRWTANKSLERMEQYKYSEKSQNCVHEDNKGRLNSVNSCCHSV
jgi:hypothetical protein